MDDTQLDLLTSQELLELKERIDLAIRAAIRSKLNAKTTPTAQPAGPPQIDLERERDAWLSAKR